MESTRSQAAIAAAGADAASRSSPEAVTSEADGTISAAITETSDAVVLAPDAVCEVPQDSETALVVTPGFVSWLTGLRQNDRRLLRLLLTVFLACFSVEWLVIVNQKPRPPVVIRGDAFQRYFSVEINTATWIDWMQLEGIGPTLAHRIEADRKLNGPFQSIDDLQRVPGIGPVKLEQIRPWLTITAEAEQTGNESAEAVP